MKPTPFHDFHLEHGAKLVEYAGYAMPLHYGSLLDEHRAVRTSGGIFDVSHMGRLMLNGRHARRMLERICTRKVSDMKIGQCRYALICHESGGVIDDVIVYRLDEQWLIVCNAGNRPRVLEHIQHNRGDWSFNIEDQTDTTAMIALQGPRIMDLIGQFSQEVPTLKRYQFAVKNLMVLKLTISRTGYTGEDGVEVILPSQMTQMALKLFLGKAGDAIRPCGLGCRDTLRMEAGMPLYGHELTDAIDPLSAGLDFAVTLDKGRTDDQTIPPFIGQEALMQIAADGSAQKLVGIRLDGRRSGRQGMTIRSGNALVGHITSGCLSPTLGYPIAMAYVASDYAAPDTELEVDFGSLRVAARTVELPFYRRQ